MHDMNLCTVSIKADCTNLLLRSEDDKERGLCSKVRTFVCFWVLIFDSSVYKTCYSTAVFFVKNDLEREIFHHIDDNTRKIISFFSTRYIAHPRLLN